MSERAFLGNARIVTPRGIVDGTLAIEDGRIAAIAERSYAGAADVRGALVMPGIVDVHTDYLEKELCPRPGAEIPLEMALHVMDLRALGCGLTTVLSAARVSPEPASSAGGYASDGLGLARDIAALAPRLRARHLVHVRWDTRFEPIDGALGALLAQDGIGNVVFNDSLPGERQFRDMDALARKAAIQHDISYADAERLLAERIANARRVDNRARAAAAFAGRLPLGSHDDTTVEHVVEAAAFGATLCEMPVTLEAARAARERGMLVCMGAPNYVRGGSHCGNLAAAEALGEGLVDMFCSDYHFPSLPATAVRLLADGVAPAFVAALLAGNPARHLGLDTEIGSLEPGKAADLVVFHARDGYADVIQTWVAGTRQFAAHDGLARPVPA